VEVAERLYVALQRASSSLRALDGALGISPARFSTLTTLRYGGPQRLGELARLEGVSQPTMTQSVHGMEADGLVRREPAPDDGRGCVVALTPQGRAVVRRGRARKIAWVRDALAEIDPAAQDALLAAVEALDAGA
jgi:DNA-binding MarR family transcriptional regulator